VNEPLLQILHPEQVEVEICRSEELDRRRGLTSELDEMWSYVRSKAHPRWLWHAIDHQTGKVLAYVFGRRQDDVFLQLRQLLEPFGITKFYTDGWGAGGALHVMLFLENLIQALLIFNGLRSRHYQRALLGYHYPRRRPCRWPWGPMV
jgi:IS1 transposase